MGAVLLAVALSQAPLPEHAPFAEGETCAALEFGGYTECKGTVAGVAYTYLLNEAGVVENGAIDGPEGGSGYSSEDPDKWVIRPERDKVEDTVAWYAFHYKTGLMLAMTPTGQISAVCVIGADFPGRPIAVRVGTAPAFKASENCKAGNTAALRTQLLKGGRLITRGYKWPYDYPVDKEGRAENFDDLLELYAFLRRY